MLDTLSNANAFAALRPIFHAWGEATSDWIGRGMQTAEVDKKTDKTLRRQFADSETILALGYVIKATNVEAFVMQSALVRALTRDGSGNAHQVRQSLSRRFDALEYYGLIERRKLQENAVQILRTPNTTAFHALFDSAYAGQLATLDH